jgi:hypothetical protein
MDLDRRNPRRGKVDGGTGGLDGLLEVLGLGSVGISCSMEETATYPGPHPALSDLLASTFSI